MDDGGTGTSVTTVVQVHPLEDSYNAALLEQVLAALDPPHGATTPDGDPDHRRGPADRTGSANRTVRCFRLAQGQSPDAATLAATTRLVLVYPTWSGGLPSALLQWVHDRLDDPGPLGGITEIVAVTSHGSSRFVNRVQGEWGRRYLRRELLGCCARGARFRWIALYKVDRRTPEQMAAHLDTVGRRLRVVS